LSFGGQLSAEIHGIIAYWITFENLKPTHQLYQKLSFTAPKGVSRPIKKSTGPSRSK
jgi:hypothetical protein